MSRRPWAPFLALALSSLLAVAGFAAPVHAQATAEPATPTPTPIGVKSYILVDADRGVVLAAVNHHEPVLIASLSKVMTAFVALEQLQPTYEIEVSALAASKPAMRIGMQPGQRWKLDDALHSLLMVSANDAAYALAEAAAGSVEEFSRLMQRTADRLGMNDSRWLDPAGLDRDEGFGGGTTASAYDLAIIARNALHVPEIAAIVAKTNYEFVGGDGAHHTLENHNKMLTLYEGANGLKTGYTKAAGRTLIASATRNGRTMIAVVLGSSNDFGDAGTLLDQGFNTAPDAKGINEVLPPTSFTRAEAAPVATEEGAHDTATSSDGGLLASLKKMMTMVLFGLVVAFFARREQIKRRKRRRAMMRRAYLDAKRRGMIDVIDAERYYGSQKNRTHVQVMRPEEDLWPPREMQRPHTTHRRGRAPTRH